MENICSKNNIERLIQISTDLECKDISNQLEKIAVKLSDENCPLILPLVGEFSSGKTTLINALTDCKALETATKPTTATIFEVHFGCDSCKAEILHSDGQTEEVDDITSLKNDKLADVPAITVFDTSKAVPSSIVLVDTPGLSSPDLRHRQTLMNFLPQADALLFVIDINAQITRSLTDFIKTTSLSHKKHYFVFTKIDTKSASEVESSVAYLEKELNINKKDIIYVAATKGDVSQLQEVLHKMQVEKSSIIEKVNEQRLHNIIKNLLSRIDELLKAPNNSNQLEEEITRKKQELNMIKRKISKIIANAKDDIEIAQQEVSNQFVETISPRLETLVAGKSGDYNAEAVSIINNTATLVLNNYQEKVKNILRQHSREKVNDNIDLGTLENIDVSDLTINEINFNLDLNNLGHKYDGYIATGLKYAIAAAAVAATASVVAASTTATAATAAKAAKDGSQLIDMADTATDIGSMVVTSRAMSRMQKMKDCANKINEQYEKVEKGENNLNEKANVSGGIINSMVGLVTDKTMGKPQRRRAIHDYIDISLMPQFKMEMNSVTAKVVNNIQNALEQSAENIVNETTEALTKLKKTLEQERTEYEKRISTLRDYKNELALL